MPVEKIRRISTYLGTRIMSLTDSGLTPLNIRKRLIQEEEIAILTRSIKLYIERKRKELQTGQIDRRNPRHDRRILQPEHLAFIDTETDTNDESTAPEMQRKLKDRFGIDVSLTSIRRARSQLGWTYTSTRYCQMVRDVNKLKRLEFCKTLLNTNEHFNDVIFTDESTIKIQSTVRKSFRRRGCLRRLKGVPKHPYSVHVWAGISRKGATAIAIFTGRLDSLGYQSILTDYFLPFIRTNYPEGHRLYQDNDPKHTSKSTKAYFEKEGVKLMPAPPESPDLNPIELMWAALKYHLRKTVKPTCKEELVSGIAQFWEDLKPETCSKYIDHIYNVAPAVIAVDGSASGY